MRAPPGLQEAPGAAVQLDAARPLPFLCREFHRLPGVAQIGMHRQSPRPTLIDAAKPLMRIFGALRPEVVVGWRPRPHESEYASRLRHGPGIVERTPGRERLTIFHGVRSAMNPVSR